MVKLAEHMSILNLSMKNPLSLVVQTHRSKGVTLHFKSLVSNFFFQITDVKFLHLQYIGVMYKSKAFAL